MSNVRAENLSPRLIEKDCASVMLARFAIANSSDFGLPVLSNFSPSTFTISAFDNFDHVDKNTLSGKSGSHNTVITLFQEIPTKKEMKPNKVRQI